MAEAELVRVRNNKVRLTLSAADRFAMMHDPERVPLAPVTVNILMGTVQLQPWLSLCEANDTRYNLPNDPPLSLQVSLS